MYDLLYAVRRVRPPSDAVARLEVFGRYQLWPEGSANRLGWVTLVCICVGLNQECSV